MPQSNTISILMVDDDPAILDSFKIILEREPGYVVSAVETGTDALDLLDTQYFDVIISDYAMPDIDGVALLREVRARGCQSLFVIVTGKRLAHIAMDALNSGADFFIQKGPNAAKDLENLIGFVRTHLPEKKAGSEIAEWERFYHSVVESTPDLLCRMLADGSFIYTNETCQEFFKKPYNDMTRLNFFSLIPAEEKSAVLAQLRNLSTSKPDIAMEHRIQADGKTPVLQWFYHAFFDSGGIVSEYQVSGRTLEGVVRIGERVGGIKPASVTPAAVASAPREPAPAPQKPDTYDWKALIDTIQSLENPVFAIDKSGTVIAWNRAIEELTGIAGSQMVGKGRQEYAVPFYGRKRPMLIDHIFLPPDSPAAAQLPPIKKVGDAYIGEMEHVMIKGKPMLLWGKGSPVYDGKGNLIAAIEVITVGEPHEGADAGGLEKYLGGVSSITLKVSGDGVGGAIAGAIGSSTGGYGVYATDQRIFVIRNPDLNAETAQGVQFGTFLMDELFGTTVDTRQKSIKDLEKLRVFEAWKKDIVSINMKKPVLLSGYLTFVVDKAGSFRIYIDHKKSFTHLEQLMQAFCPEKIRME
ncbi:MAG: response regulator [Methanoregula sp.]|nr:response regulator [Methanoregula sp.]